MNRDFVFISYSSADRLIADKVTELLKKLDIDYWIAPDLIPAGSNYAREIPQAIKGCSLFLLIVSEKSQNSVWVEKEIDAALSQRKKIIPLQIDDVELQDVFRFYLSNVQILYYDESKNKPFRELEERLRTDFDIPEEAKAGGLEIAFEKMRPAGERIVNQAPEEEEDEEPTKLDVFFGSNKKEKSVERTNALRMNRIPDKCGACGNKRLIPQSMGIYHCSACGMDNYDDFQKIRNYLNKKGRAPSIIIERDTGVPRRIVDHFFKQEYLEIPLNSAITAYCERCRTPIRTGQYCNKCKAKLGINMTRTGSVNPLYGQAEMDKFGKKYLDFKQQ